MVISTASSLASPAAPELGRRPPASMGGTTQSPIIMLQTINASCWQLSYADDHDFWKVRDTMGYSSTWNPMESTSSNHPALHCAPASSSSPALPRAAQRGLLNRWPKLSESSRRALSADEQYVIVINQEVQHGCGFPRCWWANDMGK